jgi:hypothetical protein
MSKFLRQIEFRGFLRDATHDESRPNLYNYFEPHDNFLTGLWAYARYALPVRCDGVAKINCYGCPNTATRCDEPCLNIASLWISIPERLPTKIDGCLKQQEFMVELAHRGLKHASNEYRFDFSPFEAAKSKVDANQYRFEFQIGNTKKSPNRSLAAFIWCFYDHGFKTEVVFTTRDGGFFNRTIFATANEQTISAIRWLDQERVQISSKDFNGSYWICDIHGNAEFVFGLASSNSPHHIYMHATILINGQGVLAEREKGIELMNKAAGMGFKHAINYLSRL